MLASKKNFTSQEETKLSLSISFTVTTVQVAMCQTKI